MKKIITAMGNENLNQKLKKENILILWKHCSVHPY